uniref:Uncharacterized protein n=1 Tax=Mesocestoides corti TaxID=53468 RepID=A0A5K3EXZ4_MESCO
MSLSRRDLLRSCFKGVTFSCYSDLSIVLQLSATFELPNFGLRQSGNKAIPICPLSPRIHLPSRLPSIEFPDYASAPGHGAHVIHHLHLRTSNPSTSLVITNHLRTPMPHCSAFSSMKYASRPTFTLSCLRPTVIRDCAIILDCRSDSSCPSRPPLGRDVTTPLNYFPDIIYCNVRGIR